MAYCQQWLRLPGRLATKNDPRNPWTGSELLKTFVDLNNKYKSETLLAGPILMLSGSLQNSLQTSV
jgi:hypothetical protein